MRTIALVEDNPDNRLLVNAILASRYSIDEYATGQSALEAFVRSRPDLVLLDVSLPGLDGAGVLQRLRADPRFEGLPVVALTAHAMAGDREKYLAMGFDEYVSKPITDENLLLQAVERFLPRE